MRITNSMMVDNLLTNLYSGMGRLDKYNSQLATNKRITRLSDDSVGVLNSMNARQRIFRIQQYQENIVTARNWVDQTEVALMDVESTVLSIKENLVAAGGTNNADDKKNYATLISELKNHIFQSLNSAVGDKFLFAGFNTTKPPFTVDNTGKILYNGKDLSDATYLANRTPTHRQNIPDTANAAGIAWDPAVGIDPLKNNKYYITTEGDKMVFKDSVDNVIGEINNSDIDLTTGELDLQSIGLGVVKWTPQGTMPTTPEGIEKAQKDIANSLSTTYITTPSGEEYGQNIEFEVGFSLKMEVSFTGIDVVGTGDSNMFVVLDEVINALNNNASIDTISALISKVDTMQSGLMDKVVNIGSRSLKVDSLENRYSQDFINYEKMRADIEDIDPAQVIMQFKISDAIYKQALATGARIIQPTLMDFLR